MKTKPGFLIIYFLLLLILSISCRRHCDGDSFFSWITIEFEIIDRNTHEGFFESAHPDYDPSEFKIIDNTGREYENSEIHLFPDYTGTYEAIGVPITKYYYFHYNDFDQDTMKVIIKGTYSDPCNYEEAEYVKVFYNNKVVYYDLYPRYGYGTDLFKIYKEK